MRNEIFIRKKQVWQEAFLQSQPFVDTIANIRAQGLPTYLLTGDGLELIDDGLPECSRELIKECEDAIEAIHRKARRSVFGLPVESRNDCASNCAETI